MSAQGRRLLAHELTHVIHQGRAKPLRSGAGRQTLRRETAYPGAIQRAPDTPEPKKAGPQPQAAAGDVAFKSARETVADTEKNWTDIRDAANKFTALKGWTKKGDEIVGLLKQHTEDAINASKSSKSALFQFYLDVIEADLVMYRFVSWHVVVHMNILGMKSDLDALHDAFVADKPRLYGAGGSRGAGEDATRFGHGLSQRGGHVAAAGQDAAGDGDG